MTEREKVINELRFQLDSKEVKEQHCSVQLSISDAETILALLKKQEPKSMIEVEDDDDLYAWSPEDVCYYCPECEKEISYDYNFCPYCGQAVKF